MSTRKRKPRAALLFVFFLSGIGALLYQIVWLKYLGLVFGNTVYAAATLIAVFLAGLGIGAYAFSRLFRRASPLLVYALLEALIGTMGALSPHAFDLLDGGYIATYRMFLHSPFLLALSRVVGSSLFLLPPTILMGGTLPVLVRWWAGGRERGGRAVSSLYGANTFGATVGVALAGFLLIPLLGFLTTIFAAVVLNFTLALISTFVAFLRGDTAREEEELAEATPSDTVSSSPVPRVLVLAASFAMGFAAIADEVFWSRVFVLHLGSSVYAYSLMLFSFLIGIAIGSSLIYRVIARVDACRLLGALELGLAAILTLQVVYLTHFSSLLFDVASVVHPKGYSGTLVVLAVSVLSAVVVPTAIMGAAFPLAVKLHAEREKGNETRSVGSIYLANTAGSIAGSFMAGFVLIRAIGSQNGLFAMAAINLLVGAVFLHRSVGPRPATFRARRIAVASIVGTLVACAGLATTVPLDQVILSAGLFQEPRSRILYFREDVTATVTLRKLADKTLSLELNGVNVAGTSPDLVGTQKLQGHLPLLLDRDPKRILHIGFGSGGTAYSVSRYKVDDITIAEISPEVLEASDRYLRQVNHGVLHDPRVHVVINDGRNFVLASPEKFDAILSDSIHPRYAGNGSLYTEDYFELCRKRLKPGGVISMWLPTYSLTLRNYLMILRAFRDVFPNTTVWYVPNTPNAFTIVVGRLEDGPIPLDRIARRMTPVVRRDLRNIGMSDPYRLASALLLDPISVEKITRDVPPTSTTFPRSSTRAAGSSNGI